jgi:tRNA threonylcarbamoyl adenosine modification protein (Sua5/YciO/YrdC/YwlC family)
MSQFLEIHPVNPQSRLIKQTADSIRAGGVVALPTDSCYILVCHLDDKDAVTRMRRIRDIDDKQHLTVLCRDLSEIAQYARIDNKQYRLLKSVTPGAYTFILEATKEVPRRLSHPSRKTIGIRIPDHVIVQSLLAELDEGLIATTLIPAGQSEPLTDANTIREQLDKVLDVIVDGGACDFMPTTVVDLSGGEPELIRQGRGDVRALGL